VNVKEMDKRDVGHAFSVEMKSKRHVKHIFISDEAHERVLFEGFLGELEELGIIEGAMLEVRGTNEVLRIDLSEGELQKVLSKKKEAEPRV